MPGLTDHDVEAVQARRASLRRACAGVQEALRTPGGPGEGAVLAAVRELRHIWHVHTSDTERRDGVLDQVVADCPRLSPAVGRLRHEHQVVAESLRAVERLLDETAAEPHADGAGEALPTLTGVLDTVDRHRRMGRDLLYQAYNVDLGLGE
ncbi:MAG TPA: hypothetical protein VI248_16250 [Kineosporiaceae bacterium]